MKNFLLLLWLPLLLISNIGFSQQNEIKIRFISNAGLYLSDGTQNIYVDFPYKSGFWIYSEYDKSEIIDIKENAIFIFTHKHPDHYSKKRVRKLSGKKYGPWNISELEKLNNSIHDFSVQAFKTKHRFSKKHCSYLITWHNKRIFISGDTEHAETIEKINNIDWAFVPAWLIIDAQKKGIKIDTKMFGLYHIGPGDHINSENPKILLLNKQGETITLPY